MIDSHDYHNPFNPINQKEIEYTDEQLLIEQIETLETRLKEKVEHVLYLQSQLKRLAEMHAEHRTFGYVKPEILREAKSILVKYE